jgi:hypothetical protein
MFQLASAFAQDEPYLKKHWFTTGKVCAQELTPEQLFPKPFPNPDDVWKVSSITKVNAVGVCRKTEKGIETSEVLLGLSYVDIAYKKKATPDSVFNAMATFLMDKNTDWHAELNMSCKAGKIFCLSRDSCTIRVISVNSCAHMKDFEKLIAFYKNLKKYDTMLFVKCGSGPQNVELFRKN